MDSHKSRHWQPVKGRKTMSSVTPNTWVAFLAAVGIGTIIAAFLGLLGVKAVAISYHRQNWINALREDLALYLKEIDMMHLRLSKTFGHLGQPAELGRGINLSERLRSSRPGFDFHGLLHPTLSEQTV